MLTTHSQRNEESAPLLVIDTYGLLHFNKHKEITRSNRPARNAIYSGLYGVL
jgi:hypothetical protein